jgi:beta-lactamase regulating signal transducer with metallopeptidase domain
MSLPLTSIAWGLIQITVLCAGGLVSAWLLRGRRPQATTAVLSGCCVAALILAIIAWIPQTQWSLVTMPNESFAQQIASREPTLDIHNLNQESPSAIESSTAANASPGDPAAEIRTTSIVGSRLVSWILAHVQGLDENVRSAERSSSLRVTRWSAQGFMFFLAGFAIMTGLWLYGWLYMWSIIRHSKPMDDESVERLVAEYAAQLGLRRPPQLRLSNQVPIGATVGCFRHELILHTDWSQWNENELRAVIVHELAHAARWDFLWVVISSWVRILFFFHPLIHCVVRRMRLEQELAADQLAAGMMNNANAYGRALASLTLRSQYFMRAPSPMLSAEQICIVRRIKMLKHGSLVPRDHLWRWASCLTLVTTLSIVPLSGLRGTPPDGVAGDDATSTIEDEKDDGSRVTDEGSEERAKQTANQKLQDEVNAKFPPLKFIGSMFWQPGRFQSVDFEPGMRWSHLLYTVAGLGTFPEEGQLHGETDVHIGWSDLAREHGTFMFGGQIKQADRVAPTRIAQFVTSSVLGPNVLTNNEK